MPSERILSRALGAYLGFACGDALGATLEFMKPAQIQKRFGLHQEIIGGGWLGLAPGEVTDDTQMSLALGQAILDHQAWNIQSIADNFVAWLESNPPDIGNTTLRGINRYREKGELFGLPRADEAGNGACMRNLPVALLTLYEPAYFEEWSLQQSHITHNHHFSDAATLTLGRMVHALLKEKTLDACYREAELLVKQYSEFAYTPYPGKTSAYIVDTVQTVLHHFFKTDNFESCLIETVNQGGDADTTGALAGMLAGARYGVQQIPERWLQQLNQRVATQIKQQTRGLLSLGKLL